jgi:hypothetical protein
MSSQKGTKCTIIKFAAIISLDASDLALELGLNKGMKRDKGGENIRLVSQRKAPGEVSKIIQHNEIIFKTRVADHRRSPDITMNNMKGESSNII